MSACNTCAKSIAGRVPHCTWRRLTTRCRRTVSDKVLTSRPQRAAAELGRYTDVGCGGISPGELESSSVQRPGLFTVAPADRASTLSASQRAVGACCDTSRDSGQQRCSARDFVPGLSAPLRSSPLVNRQVLGCGSFRAFSNPLGITSRCSGTGYDKAHGRHGHLSFTCRDSALGPHRPPAELGR